MNPNRKLSLNYERLGELATEELRQVAAGIKIISVQADCGLSTMGTDECEGRSACAIRDIILTRDKG